MGGGVALDISMRFETICCYKCEMVFAISDIARKRLLDSGNTFYCPAGHNQHYTESNVDKLEKQLKNTAQRLKWEKTENTHLTNRLRAEKGAKTKLKKRINNGVCPCCKRSFKNLQRHMSSKHKNYAK